MENVGIITFHAANNFGAVLQCYALKCAIEELGFDVEIIDYRPDSIVTGYKAIIRHPIQLIKFKGLIKAIKRIFNVKLMIKLKRRNKKFDDFRKSKFKTSKHKYFTGEKLKTAPPIYDYYVAGSDQIWNPYLTNGLDDSYFLMFSPNGKKRIAYGASLGQTNDICDEIRCLLQKYIQQFDYISTREKTANNLLKEISNKKIVSVLDPALLLTAREWDKIVETPKINRKYIFLYDLHPNDQLYNFANWVSEKYNLGVICFRKTDIRNVIKEYMYCGPGEFLGLLKNSELVITNSFHGTVFSVIYQKPFYTFPHGSRGERMLDFLNTVGLEDRVLYKAIDKVDFHIKYDEVEQKLNIERERSLDFLKEALLLRKTF